MMKRKEPILIVNVIALGVGLMNFIAIAAILVWVFGSNQGMFFGMMLAFLFPVLLILAVAGAVVYAALLVSNVWITIRRKKAGALSRQLGYTWLVFGGVTTTVVLITIVCAVVSAPLVAVLSRTLRVSNPFLTAPVRSVPAYPSTIRDDQSQYQEMSETLFRSYNVPSTHPDQIADWYQDVLSEPPWSVVQVNRYIEDDETVGRIVLHCIQTQRDEGNGQQRTYFIEIFSKDEISYWGTHVNIGTPNPVTNICEQFLEEP